MKRSERKEKKREVKWRVEWGKKKKEKGQNETEWNESESAKEENGPYRVQLW
jgi:hypothetical protein